jgi:hypothetical protein
MDAPPIDLQITGYTRSSKSVDHENGENDWDKGVANKVTNLYIGLGERFLVIQLRNYGELTFWKQYYIIIYEQ